MVRLRLPGAGGWLVPVRAVLRSRDSLGEGVLLLGQILQVLARVLTRAGWARRCRRPASVRHRTFTADGEGRYKEGPGRANRVGDSRVGGRSASGFVADGTAGWQPAAQGPRQNNSDPRRPDDSSSG